MTSDLTHLVCLTQQVLADQRGWRVPPTIQHVLGGSKSVVVRMSIDGAPPDVPATVIVKQTQSIGGIAYDPTSTDSNNPAQLLFNEWAAYEFVRTIPCDPPLTPRLYGGDPVHGLLVLEDLGDVDGPTTLDPMAASNPEHARHLLLASVRSLAQLHGMTMRQDARYRAIRQALGPQAPPTALFYDPWPHARLQPSPTDACSQVIAAYQAMRQILGLPPASSIDAEIARIIHDVEENPGPFLALCQGDQNLPGRLLRSGALPRRFDFDQAGFRHALLEGMPGRMTWGCMLRIPASIVVDMDRAYQEALRPYCPVATDTAAFQAAQLVAGGRWHIFHVLNRIPAALERDAPRGRSSRRQQNIAWQEAFAQLSNEFDGLPALGRSAHEIGARLRRLWPDVEPLPYYPAFAHDV